MRAVVGILGGTGKEGQGLALRWGAGGRRVVLGSRDPDKARRVALELNDKLGSESISGSSNAEAAREAEVIVSTLPHEGHLETVRGLKEHCAGKLLVTATIRWPPGRTDKPSAAEELQETLQGAVRVAAAFQTVSAGVLRDLESTHDEDVLVFADDAETRRAAKAFVAETGLRAVEGGPLEKARVAEALTGLLIGINKLHGVRSAGIRITGLPSKKS